MTIIYRIKVEENTEKKLTKLNDETFCVKKCQFGKMEINSFYLHLTDKKPTRQFYRFDTTDDYVSLCLDRWELFEETKEVYWFRRKGGK
jgi:hypothetical protein